MNDYELKGNYFMSEEVVESEVPKPIKNVIKKGVKQAAEDFKPNYNSLLTTLERYVENKK